MTNIALLLASEVFHKPSNSESRDFLRLKVRSQQKSLEWMNYVLDNFSNANGMVMDPFAGTLAIENIASSLGNTDGFGIFIFT